MMKQMLQRGFTLIELLVVIAIIGILAAVVLASLNDARDSGQDASIKQSMGNLRSQAELTYNQDGYDYAGVCAETAVQSLLTAAANNRAETTDKSPNTDVVSDAISVTCNDSVSGYAAIAPLNVPFDLDGSGPNGPVQASWCVDSTGFSGPVAPGALSVATDITCQ